MTNTQALPTIPFTNGTFRWKVSRALYGTAVKVTLQKKKFGIWWTVGDDCAYDGRPWGTTREVAIQCANRVIKKCTSDGIYGYHYNKD